jgi:hypothetical protein
MAVLAAIAAATLVYATRGSVELDARRDDDIRVQALWLARTALDAGFTGNRVVATQGGPASVHADAEGATVELAGARATVRRDPWTERYSPAAAPDTLAGASAGSRAHQ